MSSNLCEGEEYFINCHLNMQLQVCRHLSKPGYKDCRKGSCLEIRFHVTKNTKEVSCYNKVKMVTKETKVSYRLA